MKHMHTGSLWPLHFSRTILILTIWSLVPLPSLKPACIDEISWSSLLFILLMMILRSILLAWEMRLMVRELAQSFKLLFFGNGIKTALHQSFGHSSFCNKTNRDAIADRSIPSSPVAFHISADMSSVIPGDFPFPN